MSPVKLRGDSGPNEPPTIPTTMDEAPKHLLTSLWSTGAEIKAKDWVFVKKSVGFQSRIPDGNWWNVTCTMEWLGFGGLTRWGGCFWGLECFEYETGW